MFDTSTRTTLHSDLLSRIARRERITERETIGLVGPRRDSRGPVKRIKLIETTFDPARMIEARDRLADGSR